MFIYLHKYFFIKSLKESVDFCFFHVILGNVEQKQTITIINEQEVCIVTATNSEEMNSLFLPDAIFLSEETTKKAVFEDIAKQLVEKGLVKETFLENLIKREESFPTGMDLSVVDKSLPNIGIPHTEGEFVNTRCVIPVKLMTPVSFNNMINPSDSLEVSFLFMILNNDPGAQTNILSDIMGFISTVDPEQLNEFFNYTDKDKIYQFLQEKF